MNVNDYLKEAEKHAVKAEKGEGSMYGHTEAIIAQTYATMALAAATRDA